MTEKKTLQPNEINYEPAYTLEAEPYCNPALTLQQKFELAVVLGEMPIIELLLNEEEIDINQANEYGYTPIVLAIEEGSMEQTVAVVIDHINCTYKRHIRPNMSIYREIIKLLLEHGARLDIPISCRKWDTQVKQNYNSIEEWIEQCYPAMLDSVSEKIQIKET